MDKKNWPISNTIHAALKPTPQMEAIHAALKPTPQMEAIQAALKPTLQMEAIQAALKPTPQMEAIHAALKPTPQMEAIHAALKPTQQMEAIRAVASALPTMAALRAVLGPIGSIAESFSAAVGIGASLAALGSVSSMPDVALQKFSPGIADALSTAARIFHEDDARQNKLTDIITRLQNSANDNEIPELARIRGNEISQQLSAAALSGDLSLISDKAKKYLISVFWFISFLLSGVALEGAVRTEACQWQPTIWPGMTAGQKGKAIRKAACDVPTEVQKDHRYVHGNGVHLRDAPSMKGAIQSVVLYDGDLLEVLSSDNRNWLKVSIVGKTGSEGWVSRRYVRAIVR